MGVVCHLHPRCSNDFPLTINTTYIINFMYMYNKIIIITYKLCDFNVMQTAVQFISVSLCIHILSVSCYWFNVLNRAEVHKVGGAMSLVVELFGVGQHQLIMHGRRVANTCRGQGLTQQGDPPIYMYNKKYQ